MGKLLFQFLIGRLLTVVTLARASYTIQFQFLIGRLLTTGSTIQGIFVLSFQFLIGRLITPIIIHYVRLYVSFNSS
mgnify:CR=1 FL=1